MTDKGNQDNLWLSLLNQASTRISAPEATCVILGEPNCGKANVIAALAQQQNFHNVLSQLELINYNFIDVEDSSLASPTKVHLWQLDEKLLPFAKDLILADASSNNPVSSSPTRSAQSLLDYRLVNICSCIGHDDWRASGADSEEMARDNRLSDSDTPAHVS